MKILTFQLPENVLTNLQLGLVQFESGGEDIYGYFHLHMYALDNGQWRRLQPAALRLRP